MTEDMIKDVVEDIFEVMKATGKRKLLFDFRIMPEDRITSVAVLDLPTRVINRLEKNQLNTIADLAEFVTNASSFNSWRGVGEKTKIQAITELLLFSLKRESEIDQKNMLAGVRLI